MTTSAPLADHISFLRTKATLADLCMDAWILDDAVYLSDLTGTQSCPRGTGMVHLLALIEAAHRHGHPVRLCCTAWNTGLRDYYGRAGFYTLQEEDDEVLLTTRLA